LFSARYFFAAWYFPEAPIFPRREVLFRKGPLAPTEKTCFVGFVPLPWGEPCVSAPVPWGKWASPPFRGLYPEDPFLPVLRCAPDPFWRQFLGNWGKFFCPEGLMHTRRETPNVEASLPKRKVPFRPGKRTVSQRVPQENNFQAKPILRGGRKRIFPWTPKGPRELTP